MYERKIRPLVLGGLVVIAAYAAGFLAGHLRANGRNSFQHGIELESIRLVRIQGVKHNFYPSVVVIGVIYGI
jgi:hypothetical protein